MTHVGRMLKTYRFTQNLEQQALADQIGITPAQLSRLENGRGSPDAEQVLSIAAWMIEDVDAQPADLVQQAGEVTA